MNFILVKAERPQLAGSAKVSASRGAITALGLDLKQGAVNGRSERKKYLGSLAVLGRRLMCLGLEGVGLGVMGSGRWHGA